MIVAWFFEKDHILLLNPDPSCFAFCLKLNVIVCHVI
jgi:hypothetical protein